jgi:ABC-2 type transport system ATP-binding protein
MREPQQTDQTRVGDVIQIEDLRVVRGGREVLHGISLSVPRGSVAGLLGPSGCGKTTLMRAIVGVQIVAGGTVRVLGLPAGAPELRSRVSRHAREKVGYVTQAPSVYWDLTVQENLRYFAAIVEAGAERVAETLEAVGLGGHEDQLTASLSGGERARVSLASALLGHPELLVLDEPTVGLDPVLRAELWKTFHRLAADGTTLLVSSHVMDEAAECDRLLLMRDGSLLDQMTPQALRDRTGEHDLGRAFLAVIEAEGGR